ncbi:MAG: adenylyl-sulfate kinase [Telmatospirillum sp.]|nr:adenylyl-sulfate kinase [Telmatospirillum sp.]
MAFPDATPGTVFWVTGLSGAGKTTLAQSLVPALRARGRACALLDGDMLRAILGRDAGSYDRDARRELAFVYARLAHALATQGIDAVCATISMFDAVRDWNRANNASYVEIYLDVALAERVRRDPKGIYARAQAGTEASVPGFDDAFEAPKAPDLVFGPDPLPPPDACVAAILAWLDRRA